MASAKKKQPASYEPTPAEIRAACREFQKDWSDKERRKRSGALEDKSWMPPLIASSDLAIEERLVERAA